MGTEETIIKKTKLAIIMEARKITLSQLSKMIEAQNPGYVLGTDALSRIRTGKCTNYHLARAIKIAKALNVKLDDIVDEM